MNKRSNLLLVRIQAGQKPGLYIPLPLVVLDVTLASLHECLEFWQVLFLNLVVRKIGLDEIKNRPKPAEILALLIKMIDEIRSYGSFELVWMEDEENKISLRLY
ncbi:MAG TPA: hypothetical protein PLC88_03765 [Syntrophomonas sp.]|nr:hypothetical protein [Syntrophomonas sp.]